jgi:hypothetical protein
MGAKEKSAVFTIQQNEYKFLPVWVNYYKKHFHGKDIYVLDHDSSDLATQAYLALQRGEINVLQVHRLESFNHVWLRNTVEGFQRFLLQSYDAVLFVEADEIVCMSPNSKIAPDLRTFIDKFMPTPGLDWVRCEGYEVIQSPEEAALDWNKPLLPQRRYWARSNLYSKILLSKVPIPWDLGFHNVREEIQVPTVGPYPPELKLIHLHRIDYDYCKQRHLNNLQRRWAQEDLQAGRGMQNRLVGDEELKQWFYHPESFGQDQLIPGPIPEEMKSLL